MKENSIFKRNHIEGGKIRGTDKNFVIEEWPNWKKSNTCQDCGKVERLTRIYWFIEGWTWENNNKMVCSSCRRKYEN